MAGILVPVPLNFFRSQTDANRLIQLRHKENQSNHELWLHRNHPTHPPRQVIFDFSDWTEKKRLIRTLHDRIFIVEDQDGYPERVTMPGNQYGTDTGKVHIVNAAEWSNLPLLQSLQVPRWPPTTPERLFTVPRNHPLPCIGCILKEHIYGDVMRSSYALTLQVGDIINHDTPNGGIVWGRVTANNQSLEAVRCNIFDNPHVIRDIPYTWLTVNPQWRNEYIERRPPPVRPTFCNCDVARWRHQQESWHKRFKLCATADKSEVYVVSRKYVRKERPMAEFLGVLKPNYDLWGQVSPATNRSDAEVNRHRIQAPMGSQGEAELCFIDSYRYGNFTRFIRHSCKPNADWHDVRYGDMRMKVLFSNRVIEEKEEVTVDFGIEWLEEKGSCDCGLNECQLKQKQKGTPTKGTPTKGTPTKGTPKKK
ncbi:SET domain-containing protein [Lophiostoma macrostomum CBS 122681]|uniref:SET domain-containing protein n=1 Tax=Lophiostoma macrostomum CBS 122681 TaxID=1314788 RepID=A0A6A6SJ41_9PLEO|nr:SET domain-containing protein [Lophiostoma macrostomum CBS 122681]